ncbi:hypothetical protein V8G54_010315 [Vigna mungo]|uniref:Uncharacterized protein n=1 Tax=Vigna mungo TaxID=3915 RepID=A0AAQ3NZT4_VIGMU
MASSSLKHQKIIPSSEREANPSGWINDNDIRESLNDAGNLSHQFDCPQNKQIRKTEMFKNFMRYRGRYKKEKWFLFKWLDKEEKVIEFITEHILLPGRYNLIKLTPTNVCLLHAIVQKIPTNWVAIFKRNILEVGTNDGHRLPYGVFISKVLEQCGVNLTGENKLICGKENVVGKATLTCIGLKRTTLGMDFQ